MFTGIIEDLGHVAQIRKEGTNVHFRLSCSFTKELKIDQSLAHNGVCLTVVALEEPYYEVTAIEETMRRTQLGDWQVGDRVNLERCLAANGRFDGHIVQGHVDMVGTCTSIEEREGSWEFRFDHPEDKGLFTVEKGSICINGVSLTVVHSTDSSFSVALIPYTYEHTNFSRMKVGDKVNLEFDILGKYMARILSREKHLK